MKWFCIELAGVCDEWERAAQRAERAEEALQSAYKDISRLRLALIYIRDFVQDEIQPEQGGHVFDYLQTANKALEATRDSGI